MPFAMTTLDRMAGKITLGTIALHLANLTTLAQEGFEKAETRFDTIDGKFRKIEDRLSRVEHAAYQIQIDLIAIDQEIRGIHKVIDGINVRVFALEDQVGMTPLFPD